MGRGGAQRIEQDGWAWLLVTLLAHERQECSRRRESLTMFIETHISKIRTFSFPLGEVIRYHQHSHAGRPHVVRALYKSWPINAMVIASLHNYCVGDVLCLSLFIVPFAKCTRGLAFRTYVRGVVCDPFFIFSTPVGNTSNRNESTLCTTMYTMCS